MINPSDVINLSWNQGVATWIVPGDLPYLWGHFPDFPVVPGVALLDVALEAVRKKTGEPDVDFSQIRSAKFTKLVSPGNVVLIEMTAHEAGPSETRHEIRFLVENAVAAIFDFSVKN